MGQSENYALPENWSRHKAPTGHFYYYNSVTQESTYTKPQTVKPAKVQNHKKDKRQRTQETAFSAFKVDLPGTDWSVVFTSKGSHFFYNRESKESHWRIEDATAQERLQDLEKDSLLLLIAKSRGLKLNEEEDEKLNQSLISRGGVAGGIDSDDDESKDTLAEMEIEEMLQDIREKDSDDERPVDDATVKTNNPLISGYSSSEDDSDDEKEEQEENKDDQKSMADKDTEINVDTEAQNGQDDGVEAAEPNVIGSPMEETAESSEEENAIDLDMLDGLSSDEEEAKDTQQAEATFFQLLQESDLNPFGTWESESLKLISDPRFYELEDNRDRKRVFDGWASVALTLKQEKAENVEAEGIKEEQEPREPEEPFVEFIRFIETRGELDRLYVDFKKKWKKKLKKLELGDREKEKAYKEYTLYNKKPIQDRISIFKDFLLNSKIFKHNSKKLEDKESYAAAVKEIELFNEGKDHDTKLGYNLLHRIEDLLQISESIKFETKYYILPIETRLQVINEVFSLLNSV